jgi:predicted nucleotidyltransferase
MHPAIDQYKEDISIICKRYRVSKLDVFGSAARKDDFNATSSDADFLIEFAPEVKVGLGELIGIKTELENLLGRNVDLLEPEAIVNPYVLKSIKGNRESVYAA